VARALPLGSKLSERLSQLDRGIFDRHLLNMSLFRKDDLESVLDPDFAVVAVPGWLGARPEGHDTGPRCREESFAELLAYDARTYLPDDVLAKVDRMSMLNTLEVRVPLLDQSIVEFSARLPFSMKVRRGVLKWVLRQSAGHLLPAAVLRRRKKGFGLPLHRWMDRGLRTLASEVLLGGRTARRGWLNPKGVVELLEADSRQPGRRAPSPPPRPPSSLWFSRSVPPSSGQRSLRFPRP
jgi:asparagine synthase (glutamine-hydrolysing)